MQTEVEDEVALARAYLSRVAEPANVAVWAFVREHGPVAAAQSIRAGRVPPAVRSATEARRADVDAAGDVESAARHGVRLVVPESPEWPHFAFAALEHAGLRRLAEVDAGKPGDESGEPVPPLALWVRGNADAADLAALGTRSVGIVGARAATAYGLHVTADLAFALAARDITVVSGGAFGVDAAAHRAALAAGGATVIVSAGGADRPYPQANAPLFTAVQARGLVVSESPPGTAPQRHRFLSRNRLIAALAAGTVIVEAGRRSGALNTARHCRVLDRPVLAVPGPVTSPMSLGCHDLIRHEAHPAVLVRNERDVLEALGFLADAATVTETGAAGDAWQRTIDALDATARRVFDGIPARGAVRPDAIAARSGVAVTQVLAALPALELADLVEPSGDGYRVRARR